MNEIVCLMQVHDESQYLNLVETACQSICQQTIPIDKFAFYDSKTPANEILLLQKYGFHLIKTPEIVINNICLKQAWAYEQLERMGYKYIMINQADDFADPTRAEKQLKALHSFPNCGVCLCGFDHVQLESITVDCFMSAFCGWNVGFPSCWTLNTQIVFRLPLLPGFEIPHEVEWDPYTLLWLQTQTSFVVVEESLEVYNNHKFNHVHKLDPNQFNIAFAELCRYSEFIKSKLRPIYVLPFRLSVNPNPQIEDFNEWRAKYTRMSYQDHIEYHKKWAQMYPDQQHFYTGLQMISDCITSKTAVMEIGGWTGDLAQQIFNQQKDVILWDNYDLIEPPSHCADPRYNTIVRDDWLWKTPRLTQYYDVLVASNVLEHMQYEEVHKLFNWLPKIPVVVIVLPYLQRTWHNYHGAHIYRGMIDHFIEQIEFHDYHLSRRETNAKTKEEVLVFQLNNISIQLPAVKSAQEIDRELWQQWRKEECPKESHLKFKDWKAKRL